MCQCTEKCNNILIPYIICIVLYCGSKYINILILFIIVIMYCVYHSNQTCLIFLETDLMDTTKYHGISSGL